MKYDRAKYIVPEDVPEDMVDNILELAQILHEIADNLFYEAIPDERCEPEDDSLSWTAMPNLAWGYIGHFLNTCTKSMFRSVLSQL